jgi:hypothetical protein
MRDAERRQKLIELLNGPFVTWPARRAFLGVLLQLSSYVAIIASLWSFRNVFVKPSTMASAGEFRGFADVFWGAAALMSPAFAFGYWILAREFGGAWAKRDTRTALIEDTRLPVLYLRKFGRERSNRRIAERLIVRNLQTIGPLLGLAPYGSPAESGGAYRLYASDADWIHVVQRLLNCCQLVVIILDGDRASSSIWIELKEAARICGPTKLLIGVNAPRLDLVHRTEHLLAQASTVLGRALPAQLGVACFLYFDGDWTPHAVKRQRDWYEFLDRQELAANQSNLNQGG